MTWHRKNGKIIISLCLPALLSLLNSCGRQTFSGTATHQMSDNTPHTTQPEKSDLKNKEAAPQISSLTPIKTSISVTVLNDASLVQNGQLRLDILIENLNQDDVVTLTNAKVTASAELVQVTDKKILTPECTQNLCKTTAQIFLSAGNNNGVSYRATYDIEISIQPKDKGAQVLALNNNGINVKPKH